MTDRSGFAGYSQKFSGGIRLLALIGTSDTEKPSWPAAFVSQTKAAHMDASGRISVFKFFLQTGPSTYGLRSYRKIPWEGARSSVIVTRQRPKGDFEMNASHEETQLNRR